MNNFNGIGRLTKPPELRYTPSGMAVATFTLAIDRINKEKNGNKNTDFLPVRVLGKTAENCAEYTDKGSLVAVEGAVVVDKYEKNGEKRSYTYILASRVQFLSRKPQGSQPEGVHPVPEDEDMPW